MYWFCMSKVGMPSTSVNGSVSKSGKKYSVSIMIKDTSRMTESLFEKMELEMMTKQLEQQNNKDKNI